MILSLFRLRPQTIRAVPGLGGAIKRAGVRHVELDAVGDLHEIPWCQDNGWRIIAIGDSFMRTPGDVERNCTYAKVTDSAIALRDSGRCDGIEMVDEVKQDPAAYPMARQFVEWWRAAGGPPIAWPGHAPQRWENSDLSDYDSRQWNWWTCEVGKDRLNRLRGSLADPPKDGRERSALIDMSGWRYRKWVAGTQFNSFHDAPVYKRRPPSLLNIEKQLHLARDRGCDRYRLWALDNPDWAKLRAEAPLGSICDTGMWAGDERWVEFGEMVRGFIKESAELKSVG